MTYFRGGPRDKVGPSDDKGKAPMVDLDPPSTRDSDSDKGDHRVLFSPHRVGGELYAPLDLDIPDTSLLKNLNRHPSAYVRVSMMRPSLGSGRSNRLTFDKISEDLLPPYRDFLVRLGFGPFLSIPSMHICHSLIKALWERFFAETGSYHLPTLELAPTPLDWSALLGIRFGGLLVPQSTLLKVEINKILGMDALRAEYQDIYEGKGDKLKINLHALCKTIPWNSNPDEFALRRFFLYFIGSCFLGQDKSTIPAHLVGAVRDSSKIGKDSTIVHSLLDYRSYLDSLDDSDLILQPYDNLILMRPEVSRAHLLSHQRFWFQSVDGWELFLGERSLRQMTGQISIPLDPPKTLSVTTLDRDDPYLSTPAENPFF
ncbi:protein MAINTENANCE OF MERISTEMS isoform X2 [Fagus crenata]